MFKKGEYSLSCTMQNLPADFFELATYQLENEFPKSIVTRKSFNIDNIMVSGYQIRDINGVLESIVIFSTSTSLKEKALFKCALYSLFSQIHGFDTAKVFGAYINKKYKCDNNEEFFNFEDVSADTLLLIPHVEQVISDMAHTEPKAEIDNSYLAKDILPKPLKKELKAFINDTPNCLLSDLPTDLLSDKQRIIRQAHLTDTTFIDIHNLYNGLSKLCDFDGEIFILDFEAAQFVVPTWKNISPYDQLPFQYSCHKLSGDQLTQTEYLELITDPREALAKQLIKDVGTYGAILTFNARFERDVIRKLAKTFPDLNDDLLAITERLVDLHPLFKSFYYDPSQNGSWSLKAILPSIMGEDPYKALNGTSNGTEAADIYHKVQAGEVDQKQAEIELSNYCKLDTFALYKMFKFIIDNYAAVDSLTQ
jgi:hypothetical protein